MAVRRKSKKAAPAPAPEVEEEVVEEKAEVELTDVEISVVETIVEEAARAEEEARQEAALNLALDHFGLDRYTDLDSNFDGGFRVNPANVRLWKKVMKEVKGEVQHVDTEILVFKLPKEADAE